MNPAGKTLAPCTVHRAEQMIARDKAKWVVPGISLQLVYTRDDEDFIRRSVLARDHCICHLCDKPGADTVDHLVPFAHQGSEHPENKRAAHKQCNNIRGDMDLALFFRLRDSGQIILPTFQATEVETCVSELPDRQRAV